MRIPDPKANTTTEAYLAYKAGYLEESELKPSLYEPYLHFDGWLAYWAGLVPTYPVKNVGKNLFSSPIVVGGWSSNGTALNSTRRFKSKNKMSVSSGLSYIISGSPKDDTKTLNIAVQAYASDGSVIRQFPSSSTWGDVPLSFAAPNGCAYITISGRYSDNTELGALDQETDVFQNAQLEVGSDVTAYEPYTGEPEMLTDEEALVAYLSGVTDTYPEEIKDPYDVRIVGYLKYLVSARWGRPEYPVNNEEFYLSTMKPPVVPSGDTPSSDIEMDNTAEAPFIDLKMYGDTKQNSYTGEQLLAKEGLATPVSDNAFWAQGGRNLRKNNLENGWTHIVNNPNVSSTQIFVNRAGIPEMKTNTLYTIIVEVKDIVGSPTLRICQPAQAIDPFKVFSYDDIIYEETPHTNDTSVLGWDGIAEGFYVAKLTTKDTVTELALRFWTHLINNREVSFRTSVLEGDHSSDWRDYTGENWQPYVGGNPAPNPDYPQDVKVVTGEQTITVTGKNLANVVIKPGVHEGVRASYDAQNGMITLTGTATTSYSIPTDYTATNMPAGQYTIKQFGTLSNGRLGINFRRADDTVINEYAVDSSTLTRTFTLSERPAKFYLYTTGHSSGQSITGNVQFQMEAGDTATSFEPYQSQNYELNLGKNLFDKNHVYDGWVNNTGVLEPNAVWQFSEYIPVLPNTAYTVSCSRKEGSAGAFQFKYASYTNADESSFVEVYGVNRVEALTYTTPYNCHYIRVGYRKDQQADIQFEVGSVNTPYSPYFEPIELCKIGDYQDYIYCDRGGDWFIHKEIGSFDLSTGTYVATTGSIRGLTNAPNVKYVANNQTIGSAVTSGYRLRQGQGLGVAGVGWFAVDTNRVNFNTGSSTNPVGMLYYALATPTDTQITNSELISQLKALMEGGSYEDKTFIKVTATDPNLTGLLYVEAGKNV